MLLYHKTLPTLWVSVLLSRASSCVSVWGCVSHRLWWWQSQQRRKQSSDPTGCCGWSVFLQGLHQSGWQTWLAGGWKRDIFRLLLLLGEILVRLICCITVCANHELHIQGFPWVCCASVCRSVFCLFGSLSFYVRTEIIFVSQYKYTIVLKRYCLPNPFNPFKVAGKVDIWM